MSRSTQLLLPGIDWDAPPRRERPTKVRRGPLCRVCKAKVPKKPRSVMPVGHAIQTVMGIMASRLDSMTDDIMRIVGDEVSGRYECEPQVLASISGQIINALNYRFFPELYEDGDPYQPDPAGRMDGVPVQPLGLIPHRPTIAILAKHLLAGQQSPVAAMTTTVKDKQGNDVTVPLFTEADLCELGRRKERAGRAV